MRLFATLQKFVIVCAMQPEKTIQIAKVSTQYIFLVCGLALSSWAPMVPYAKERLNLNDGDLGLLLLLLGAGAISMMPLSGVLSRKYGTRIVIMVSGLIAALSLPLLVIIADPIFMGVALFFFGAGVGVIDVAMNSHGIHVQNGYGRPIMSSLHGLFSVGGLFGSMGLGLLIRTGLQPLWAAGSISILLILILIWKYPTLLTRNQEQQQTNDTDSAADNGSSKSGWLNVTVLFLGASCFAVFISEGAMLDWSALFMKENRGVSPEFAGVAYATFSVTMALMRLLGDGIVERFNAKTVVVGGGLIASFGIFLAVATPSILITLTGFVLLGIGAANIIPVFFSEGGRLKDVPASTAIPAITTMGYAGQLAGPALLGFIAHHFSLIWALTFTGALLLLVAISYALRKINN